MNNFNSYDMRRLKEAVRQVLNDMSGQAFSDGADFEHDHNILLKGVLRYDFEDTGELQFWDGTDWLEITEGPPELPDEADAKKLWKEADAEA